MIISVGGNCESKLNEIVIYCMVFVDHKNVVISYCMPCKFGLFHLPSSTCNVWLKFLAILLTSSDKYVAQNWLH